MSHLVTEAVTATDLILHPQTGDIALDTVLSAIYTIYLYYVLASRDSNTQFEPKIISNKIKYEISTINSVFSNRPLAQRCRDLSLADFLASHQLGKESGTNNIPLDQIVSIM